MERVSRGVREAGCLASGNDDRITFPIYPPAAYPTWNPRKVGKVKAFSLRYVCLILKGQGKDKEGER